MAGTALRWAIVVPVKRLSAAKTRLSPDEATRRDLALAMACDTVAAAHAATAVSSVVVVTDEPAAAEAMRLLGAMVVGDTPDAGLNPALAHGAARAADADPGAGIAALSADLPALESKALDRLLVHATQVAVAVVADLAGTGTTLLTARRVTDFAPRFGSGSRRAHVGAGATDLSDLADECLRRDVDTVDDLRHAVALGCGPSTTAALGRHPLLG